MNNQPLYVAFLWHMHQPFYKDLVTGEYVLPWVRFHAIKDYYDMVAILDNFPEIRQTFNLVPALLLQIEDYVYGKASDKCLDLAAQEAVELAHEDKVKILRDFFMANWETMIKPHPRYHELLMKRGRFVSLADLERIAKKFMPQEMLDLQVWFNLTWFGESSKRGDPFIANLIKKGLNFSEEEKRELLKKQQEVMGKIIPKYREALERRQIEISTTPFYHPILPLLCDSAIAKVALPHLTLPKKKFAHPEDAISQVEQAVKYHQERFGRPPEGMWPSEGSVSEEIIPIIAKAGIKWIATDEEILARSLAKGHALQPAELYRPYLIEKEGQTLNIIFRNHRLSDLVGFVYSGWKGEEAAHDLIAHLHHIRESLPEIGGPYLVSLALDGENAWEYYQSNGVEFFNALYPKLSKDPLLKTITIGQFIKENPPTQKLPQLFPGSWINHNFKIWIGHEEDNLAWDYLAHARDLLTRVKPEDWDEELKKKMAIAWQELFIAEGSDWCWWFGDDHFSESDAVFDGLFRKHLKNIYHLLGKPIPKYLDLPIKRAKAIKPEREPTDLISPKLDGQITDYYEWLAAGFYDIDKAKGTMHQIETVIKGIYYGFDLKNLCLRLDTHLDLSNEEAKELSFGFITLKPAQYKVEVSFLKEENRFAGRIFKPNEILEWEKVKELPTFGIGKIIEILVPFEEIGIRLGDEILINVIVEKEGKELERWPKGGTITLKAPTEDYEFRMWSA